MISLARIRAILSLTIVAFAAAAIYIAFTIVERQQALRDASHYNIVWASSQALSEFLLFEHRLAAFDLSAGGVDKDEVQLRFEIMLNRVTVLGRGDVGAMTASDPEQASRLSALAAALQEIEPAIKRLDRPGDAQPILARLAPLEPELKSFAAAANQFGGARVADDQRALLDLHWLFSGLAAGLALCGLVLIGILLVQNRVIGKARDRLHALSEDLRAARDTAELASHAKSRFLANMSHELRTPLNAIVGFSDMIADEALGPAGHPKYREYARDILRSGTHMAGLVGDILTMAKLDAGNLELDLRPIELQAHVAATLSMFLGTERARGREVVIEPGGDWPRLRADEHALRQMLLNLLSNAVKFSSPAHSVRIASQRMQDGELRLSVIDRGTGMSREQAALAVQPFRQVDESLSRRHEGTGLGLSIVKGLMERHGGRLVIESEPGVGSQVHLLFPKDLVIPLTVARVA
jgi:two-component system, cell cycle sensor histidine kinase PleC